MKYEGPGQAKKLWKQAVKEDGMTWTQILNNEGKEEQDLLKLYNITSFPTKILIDPEGKDGCPACRSNRLILKNF